MLDEQKKYALIGPQCVGKTTILKILQERYASDPGIYFLEEAARIFFESHPEITARTVDVQIQIQDLVLAREKVAHASGAEIIVCDRSAFDPIIACLIWDTQENTEMLHDNVADWLATYTIFFLLSPAGVPSIEDPVRMETEEERQIIYLAFLRFCQSNSLPIVEIDGTLEERIERIESIIFGI